MGDLKYFYFGHIKIFYVTGAYEMYKEKCCELIFIKVMKAFDTVEHSMMLKTCLYYNACSRVVLNLIYDIIAGLE